MGRGKLASLVGRLRTRKDGVHPERPTTILVVKPDTPVNSAKELAALARDKPATIPFASTGSGSVTHLALELYQSAANVKFLHVPYRGNRSAETAQRSQRLAA